MACPDPFRWAQVITYYLDRFYPGRSASISLEEGKKQVQALRERKKPTGTQKASPLALEAAPLVLKSRPMTPETVNQDFEVLATRGADDRLSNQALKEFLNYWQNIESADQKRARQSAEGALSAGNYKMAATEFRRARVLDADNVASWLSEIHSYLKQNGRLKAREAASEFIKKFPTLSDLKVIQDSLKKEGRP